MARRPALTSDSRSSEEEAVAIFFAIHALRHYSSLPFETESSSALRKFYQYMPNDIRDRIDQMKNRVDFLTPTRQASSPHLSLLLEAAIQKKVLLIDYESRDKTSKREIQLIGIYTRNGLWYCPAHCYQSEEIRVFRCDRIHSAVESEMKSMDLWDIHLGNRESDKKGVREGGTLFAELTKEGVQTCEAEHWLLPMLYVRQDGTGWVEGQLPKSDLPFFAKFFIGLGKEVTVKNPPELLDEIRSYLSELTAIYRNGWGFLPSDSYAKIISESSSPFRSTDKTFSL